MQLIVKLPKKAEQTNVQLLIFTLLVTACISFLQFKFLL
jgi:hypothetical protein